MMNLRLIFRCIGAAATAAAPALAAAADLPATRERFQRALEQVERGVAADTAGLRDYALYPYLEAARLAAALRAGPAGARDREIAAFVAAQPELPAARDLRDDWLLDLARRGDWAVFLQHYDAARATPELVCQYARARIATGDPEAVGDELRRFWQDAPQMPPSCIAPFEWLERQGQLSPAVVERRTRKALADNNRELAEWLLRRLPAAQAAPLAQWLRLLQDPAAELAALAQRPAAPVEWDGLLAGYTKLATRDPDHAQALLQRLGRERFDPQQDAELQRATALGLAWDRRAAAVDAFARLPESVADASVHEWRVRAALWNRRFDLAALWLHSLPPALAAEPRWAYWRARSLEQLGRADQARQIFESLAQDNGYYSLLSAWRLNRGYRPRSRPFTEDLAAQSRLLERPGIIRARELHFIGRDHWANAEWRQATRDLQAPMRLQAARLASHWGWHIQAVPMLADLNALDHLELSYPDAYVDEIRMHAREAGVPAELIYGVMRQESLFNPRAISSANAYGLLQLLLPTARAVARRHGAQLPSSSELLRPEVNIPLGAAYLQEMRNRFDGQFVPALAAYNAGPNAVRRWLPPQPMDADFWIENVPYNQTRGYVQRVLWHVAAYRWRHSGEPQDPAPLLQPITTPEP